MIAFRRVCKHCRDLVDSVEVNRICCVAERDFLRPDHKLSLGKLNMACTQFPAQIESLDLQMANCDSTEPCRGDLALVTIFQLSNLKSLKINLDMFGEDLSVVSRCFPPKSGAMKTVELLDVKWDSGLGIEGSNQQYLFDFLKLFPALKTFKAYNLTFRKSTVTRLQRCCPCLRHLKTGIIDNDEPVIEEMAAQFSNLTFLELSDHCRILRSLANDKHGLGFLLERLAKLHTLVLFSFDGLSGSRHFPARHTALRSLALVYCGEVSDLKEVFERCPNLTELKSKPYHMSERSKFGLTEAQRAIIVEDPRTRPLFTFGR